MTHIEVNNDLLPLKGSKQGVLNSTTGSVEHYDYFKELFNEQRNKDTRRV